ncbi:MAG: hypothetical protein ACOYL6_17370 [Bacteriovoracaceae bacterium]
MKVIISPLVFVLSFSAFAFSPSEDETVQEYRAAFSSSKGVIWDMNIDDNVFFDCDLYSVREGSAETSFMGFRVTLDGLSHKMNMNLTNGQFQGTPLKASAFEVSGRRGRGDASDPLELISIRVGKPISIENPMIDSNQTNTAPAKRTIMSRPLYLEISQIQEGPSVGYETKPLSVSALKDKRYRVKQYGVCYFSKYNSQLNNSGRGYAGNTRHAWDEVASSPWGAHPVFEGPF